MCSVFLCSTGSTKKTLKGGFPIYTKWPVFYWLVDADRQGLPGTFMHHSVWTMKEVRLIKATGRITNAETTVMICRIAYLNAKLIYAWREM